jgi:hypothetical protein
LLWRRRQSAAASWSARLDDLTRRTFPTLDAVLAEGSLVTGQVQALSAEAATLVAQAPGERARTEAGRLGAALEELSHTLEADRVLRLGSPPPSQEQLSYSTALIRQQAEQLQDLLRPPPASDIPA